ncbi:G1 family glutamic endopeptidase [Streptomyces sp. NBC_00448]|uniref:G1 family glutamic endopeptidase n=1 Tax=Streptomyces sp. NBC_00448 TaxID=2903652 RepID=UPI002E1AA486
MHKFRTAAPTRAAAAALLALSCASLAGPAGAAAPSVEFGAHHFAQPLHGFSGDSNWGGYIAQGSFTSISGSWTMPQVTCNSSNDLYAPWIGIDGYGSQTVEQTGVQVDCSSGGPEYSGWYEMYPASPVYYNEPVDAGDVFTASVVDNGGGSYSLKLADTTKGWSKTTQSSLNASDASAEAVIESPTGSYPSFNEQDFSGITVDGQSFDAYNPQAIDSGPYTETALNGGSFSIIPG